jgi:hypothetical protein
MTPDQRKAYNQKRYTPKRKRDQMSVSGADSPKNVKCEEDEYDALSSLERDVLKRTHQAQQALQRQRQNYTPGSQNQPGSVGNHLATNQQQQQTPLSTRAIQLNDIGQQHQSQQIHVQQQSTQGNGTNHQPIQLQYSTSAGGMIVGSQHQQLQAQQQPQLLTTYATQHPNA